MECGAFKLQLIQYLEGGGAKAEIAHSNRGSLHLSFYVTGVEAIHRRLAAEGLPVTPEIVTHPRSRIRSFYVTDPDGVPVELVEQF